VKLPGLVDKATDTDRRQEEAEKQCEDLVEELTLLWIRGSELCLTCMRECGLLLPAIPRWLCGLLRSG
jgi:hypothetical protein